MLKNSWPMSRLTKLQSNLMRSQLMVLMVLLPI